MIDPFASVLLIGFAVAVVAFAVSWWIMAVERLRWKRILEHPGEILIEADQGDLGSLRAAFVEIIDVLLGIVQPRESATGIDPMHHAMLPESRVIVRRATDDGWKPPDINLPEMTKLRCVGQWIAAKCDKGAIRPLSEALGFQIRERRVARFALAPLLQQFDEPDRVLLTKSSLFYHLGTSEAWDSEDRILAAHIVEALRRSHHVGSLSHLKRMAQAVETDRRFSDDLLERTRDCIRALEWQLKQERLGRTLLRPAHDNSADETLLRPAAKSTGDPASLLRIPAQHDE